jgi:hypothetical protein
MSGKKIPDAIAKMVAKMEKDLKDAMGDDGEVEVKVLGGPGTPPEVVEKIKEAMGERGESVPGFSMQGLGDHNINHLQYMAGMLVQETAKTAIMAHALDPEHDRADKGSFKPEALTVMAVEMMHREGLPLEMAKKPENFMKYARLAARKFQKREANEQAGILRDAHAAGKLDEVLAELDKAPRGILFPSLRFNPHA